jgi:hypothetical protein
MVRTSGCPLKKSGGKNTKAKHKLKSGAPNLIYGMYL